jgi:sulfatase maturation enzyme AslB (radical SAM superfamily)
MTTDITFDLSKGGFLKGWHDVIPGIREKKAGKAYTCNQCEKKDLCGFCPAFFKLETGAEDHYSQYLCSIGNFRFMRVKKYDRQGVRNAA